MPAKHHNPAKPTFYLDTSTLCDAFRSQFLSSDGEKQDPAYRPLLHWIHRVATEANLCMSFVHLSEFGQWSDTASANALAAWLDGLPVVWVHSLPTITDRENDVWVRRACDVESFEVEPFAPSLLTAFSATLTPTAVADVFSHRVQTLALLEAVRAIPNPDQLRVSGFYYASALRTNRADNEHLTDEQKSADLADNLRMELIRRARETDSRLTQGGDVAYAAKTYAVTQVPRMAIESYERDPRALPVLRLALLYDEKLGEGILRRDPGSRTDNSVLSGATGDRLHLIGAVYCDVFTCDRLTSHAIGDFRKDRGRRPQVAAGRRDDGIEGFVKELMSTWP